jgi:long-chain acyl-CoA synthetase
MVDLKERFDLNEALVSAGMVGMTTSVWARVQPDKVAIYEPSGRTRTFAELAAHANKVARLCRDAGLQPGDSVALLCSNRAEFVEVLTATMRTGLRITPINWHLTGDEVAYIAADCEAKALFAEARFDSALAAAAACPGLKLKVAIDGDLPGFVNYDQALAGLDGSDVEDPVHGNFMLYTSGTTGRPKGVFRPAPQLMGVGMLRAGHDLDADVQLCAGPAYHAAPLAFDVRAALANGSPLVFIDKWDTELVLRTIAERKVTHMHLVPIMFQRLLALPDEMKARYDVSHVKFVIHGAAPCPPEVKAAMIEWFGPVLTEYYAGSEGGAGFMITSEEWLKKPGSVGKRPAMLGSKIMDDEGNELPTGVAGTIYHQLPPMNAFQYYKDEKKTEASRRADYFTMGDVGYFDEDGYLFLTGRSAETIISGGVNIYPQEIDNEIIKHPAVEDSCVVGIPHEEWGEQVHAVVTLKPGFEPGPDLAAALQAQVRDNLAAFKVPRSVEFVADLPRSAAGKIQRNKVRAPYWEGRARQI